MARQWQIMARQWQRTNLPGINLKLGNIFPVAGSVVKQFRAEVADAADFSPRSRH
jgi:hypothetical protein